MKKCMLIILVLSILLSLTGCKSVSSLFKDPDNGPLTMVPLESPTAEDGGLNLTKPRKDGGPV